MNDEATRLRAAIEGVMTSANEAQLRELVREEVEKALHPGVIDPGVFLEVEMRDQDGTLWRGAVYRVQPRE